jgi:hypothetical protein
MGHSRFRIRNGHRQGALRARSETPGKPDRFGHRLCAGHAQGEGEFAADYYALRPRDPAKSNHNLVFKVSDRGGKGLPGVCNRATAADEFGDGMLLKQGYTIAWLVGNGISP